jgi:hypothetical protein
VAEYKDQHAGTGGEGMGRKRQPVKQAKMFGNYVSDSI